MRTTGLPVLALAILVTQPLTSQTVYNQTVSRAMAVGGYAAPLCPLKGGDFRTVGAGVSIKTALQGFGSGGAYDKSAKPDEQRKITILGNALKTATDAVVANPKNTAGWYYMGRANLYLGDLRGADSAFTKVVELSPDCAGEVGGFRQTAWRALVMPTTELLKQEKYDSVIGLLRDASIISRDYPQGFLILGVAYYNMTQYDSAIVYFRKSAEAAGTKPNLARDRADATLNLASTLQQVGRNEEAVVEYQKYLTLTPNDNKVKQQLASVLRATGKTAEASAIDQELLASSGTAGGADLTAYQLMSMGNSLFGEKRYAEAAGAYLKLLAKEPNNRDALFNLANAYFAAGDGVKLVATSQQLLAVDPMNEDDHKLLSQGYKLQNDTTNMLKAIEKLFLLPTNITVNSFSAKKGGARLVGTATGREALDVTGKVVPPAAVTLVWEFLDVTGAVVATKEVMVPALQPSVKNEFTVDVTGDGIVVWRYHHK